MNTVWEEPRIVETPRELISTLGLHPLTAEILARRGYGDPARALAFLDPNAYRPAPAADLPGMEAACRRIEQALERKERVWVWGDFDVDGQTSTALLVETLRRLGAEPGYHIPVRARESHGVNIPNLERILEQGADLVITCDTGITAHEALEWARARGLEVIVTDHHALGAELPPALAHITPRLLPAGHPLETLPGVGAAYKLAEAVLARAGRAAEAQDLLDLVALGIVADVALQTGDARYLLQRGLDRLRRTERAGLRAIFNAAEIQPAFLSEEHIGFSLAPRLNALGRLSDANPAVELLTTADPERAAVLAQELEALNAQRQLLTRQVLDAARKQLEREPALLESPILILAHPDWPTGVIGIVASQLVERFQRPVILLSTPAGQEARGSARSVAGVDITACIASQAGLLSGFGGHPMAAGLALPAANLPALRKGLARAVRKELERAGMSGGAQETALEIDAWLELEDATLELAEDLGRLAPFGAGNPPLVFGARGLRLISIVPIGRGGERSEHRTVTVAGANGQQFKVLWWGGGSWASGRDQPPAEGRFDLAYSLRASNYRAQREVSLEWVGFRTAEEDALELNLPRFELIDQRGAAHPRPLLDQLLAQGPAAVWAEGEARERVGGQDRGALNPAPTLVIWTAPPGRAELSAVLEHVQPQKVVVFALEPETAAPATFLQRLAGLVKYQLNHGGGQVTLPLQKLAAACAAREAAVRLGLLWLQAKGQLILIANTVDEVTLISGGSPGAEDAALLEKLKILSAETAAYRRLFSSAPLETLLA